MKTNHRSRSGWFAGVFVTAFLVSAVLPTEAEAKKNKNNKNHKVDVCHYDEEEGVYEPINISKKAVQKHLDKHGDWLVSEEIADNDIDENCNGALGFTYYADEDLDDYGNSNNWKVYELNNAPSGYVLDNTDCDDMNNAMFPDNPEIADGYDNDCNGEIDEGLSTETIFAIAYSNLDGVDGYQETGTDLGTDVLIAKSVDGPEGAPDGVVGAGDVIVLNKYPLDFDSTDLGEFTNQKYTLTRAAQSNRTMNGQICLGIESIESCHIFFFQDVLENGLGAEIYQELFNTYPDRFTTERFTTEIATLQDSLIPQLTDFIVVFEEPPSQPSKEVSWRDNPSYENSTIDNQFLEVDIFLPQP